MARFADPYQQLTQDEPKFTRPPAPWVWQQPERPQAKPVRLPAPGGGGGGVTVSAAAPPQPGQQQKQTDQGSALQEEFRRRAQDVLDYVNFAQTLDHPPPGRDYDDTPVGGLRGSIGGEPSWGPPAGGSEIPIPDL
jgi:hypothetical protein